MKNLKLEFKQGVFELNPENLLGAKTWEEATEIVEVFFQDIRREKNRPIYFKCSSVNFILGLGIGNMITKKCFLDILDYVDLDYEDFVSYLDFTKKKKLASIDDSSWFYNLK